MHDLICKEGDTLDVRRSAAFRALMRSLREEHEAVAAELAARFNVDDDASREQLRARVVAAKASTLRLLGEIRKSSRIAAAESPMA